MIYSNDFYLYNENIVTTCLLCHVMELSYYAHGFSSMIKIIRRIISTLCKRSDNIPSNFLFFFITIYLRNLLNSGINPKISLALLSGDKYNYYQ